MPPQTLFTVPSERPLTAQLSYNLLFSWFVGLGVDAPVESCTVFSINRDRLFRTEMAREFFQRVLQLAEWRSFVSDAHLCVDGSMTEGWASRKSLVVTDGNGPERTPEHTIHGRSQGREVRQQDASEPTELRRFKKGEFTETKLHYTTHSLSENRNGPIVIIEITGANGRTEGKGAQRMVERGVKECGAMVGANTGCDIDVFVSGFKYRGLRAHVARKSTGSVIDGGATHGTGYAMSLRRRKMIEDAFGRIKAVGW